MSQVGRRRWAWIAIGVAVAALSIVAVMRFLAPGKFSLGTASPGSAAVEPLYHCPMHPAMVSDRPRDCPICQMRMVPAKKVIYRSTMNPNEISDRPRVDSMGMEMEPIEVEEAPPGGGVAVEGLAAVRIPARKQQLIGVRTGSVRREPMLRSIRTLGRVTVDETRLHHIHTKIEGYVEMLTVNTTGEKVEKGQPLLSIFSPELLATQGEYVLARQARARVPAGALPEMVRNADELVESARRRLLLFDFTPEQIEELETTGNPSRTVTLYAPISGYVLQRNVTHGQRITPDTNLLDIANLSRVWVMASVYEYELPFVRVGQQAVMSLSYLPGKTYRGRVALVYPFLEEATRTAQVRLEFENPDLILKPQMYADVEIRSDLGERLMVPETAVLSSGTRSIVFVVQGEGYFEPREVRTGLRFNDSVEILHGLEEGETVVTSGNFLIDSESKLKAALEAASAPTPKKER
jgi:multidrug efflux pump subunit AcrA (membrane-fusion protein)